MPALRTTRTVLALGSAVVAAALALTACAAQPVDEPSDEGPAVTGGIYSPRWPRSPEGAVSVLTSLGFTCTEIPYAHQCTRGSEEVVSFERGALMGNATWDTVARMEACAWQDQQSTTADLLMLTGGWQPCTASGAFAPASPSPATVAPSPDP